MESNLLVVASVIDSSIAQEAGIEVGDIVLSINQESVNDIFDYRFLSTNEYIVFEIQKANGDIWEIEIEKEEYEDLGIEFKNSDIGDAKTCKNKCIFCFVDQMPKGMRETLYFKDDDARLSFLMGNYVTLTNMSNNDLNKIIKYRMSPINVSVHTTNAELRVFMLKNKNSGDVLKKIKKLVSAGIEVNCQIVLCRDINDKLELDKTIKDLSECYPNIRSISVVPVGITKYREGLEKLLPYDKIASCEVIDQIKNWQSDLYKKFGSRMVYIADEFYIMAERELPSYDEYEDFPQLENGVGLIATLKKEFHEYIKKIKFTNQNRVVSIATGVSSYKTIKELTKVLEKKNKHLKVNVYKIKNNFLGENITVTGLLTGADIIEQLTGKNLGDELLLSSSMLRSGENLLLDDLTLDDISEALNVTINVVLNQGKDFIERVLGFRRGY